jgi:hypothetical protein
MNRGGKPYLLVSDPSRYSSAEGSTGIDPPGLALQILDEPGNIPDTRIAI